MYKQKLYKNKCY